MSEWRPYFIRRRSSPLMSLSQTQSYHMSPSLEQGSHFSTDPSRTHGGFANSSTHSTGSTNVWPGDDWIIQSAPGLRPPPVPEYNVSSSPLCDNPTYLSYPAQESERVVWVHQDSVAPQQQYPNPMAVNHHPQYVRVRSPGERFRHRPQPYPLQPGSHTFPVSSTNASPDMRYQLQPASAPPTVQMPDQRQHQGLTNTPNQTELMVNAHGLGDGVHTRPTEKDNSMSRRQRAHLDSERKRREAINTGIHAIRKVLPDATEHDTKAAILDKALQYIGHLKSRSQAKDSAPETDVKTETDSM